MSDTLTPAWARFLEKPWPVQRVLKAYVVKQCTDENTTGEAEEEIDWNAKCEDAMAWWDRKIKAIEVTPEQEEEFAEELVAKLKTMPRWGDILRDEETSMGSTVTLFPARVKR